MKSNYSLERRLKIGNLNKGKSLSIETKDKLREKALSRDRTKLNLSEQSLLNMTKRSKPIKLFNLDFTVFGEYNSITDAAKAINCNIKTIRRALKTDKKLLKRRFIVNYIKK
jgi:Fic family protein